MGFRIEYLLLLTNLFQINALNFIDQLDQVARRQRENFGFNDYDNETPVGKFRRRGLFPKTDDKIIGVPSMAYHLPKAEPILPGHTLLKPSMSMLKSAVKFPHREKEDGAGVYGNYDNLGLPYGGTNQRLIYSEFRRMAPNAEDEIDKNTVKNILDELEERNEKENMIQKFIDNYQEKLLNEEIRRLNFVEDLNLNHLDKSQLGKTKTNNHTKYEKAINEYINDETVKFEKPKRTYDLGARRALIKINEKYFKTNSNETEGGREFGNNDHGNIENSLLETSTRLIEPDESKSPKTQKKTIMDNFNMFNHLHIDSDAPDFNEFVPQKVTIDKCTKCNWWFFNQDDFVPFKDDPKFP